MRGSAERRRTVREAARAGAHVSMSQYGDDHDIETKGDATDVVTDADREAQDAASQAISKSFPGEVVIAEEGSHEHSLPEDGYSWVIDPIDGSANYVREIPIWGTSVATLSDGVPLAGATVLPAIGDEFVTYSERSTRNGEPVSVSEQSEPDGATIGVIAAWNTSSRDQHASVTANAIERFGDVRRFKCTQWTLGLVAAGALEGAITNVETKPWDSVTGVELVRNAGGTVTDGNGERWTYDSRGLVASNGNCHEQALEVLQGM